MKKRILALSLAAAMVVGALASCTAKTEPAGSDSVEARDITLTLWGPEQDQDFLKEVSAAWGTQYAADNADVNSVTVDVKITGEGDATTAALNDISAAADVFGVASDQLSALAAANAVYEIPETLANETKSIVGDNITFRSTYWDGKCYGFPYALNVSQILYYNAAKLGEEDVKSLNTILEKGKVGIIVGDGWDDMVWFASAGAELYTDNNKDVNTMNSADVAETLKWYQTQVKAGKLIKVDDSTNAGAMLKDGQIDAMLLGSWANGGIKDALGDDYGVAELPNITVEGTSITDKHMVGFGGSKLNVINATTKEPEAALSLAQAISSEENQIKRVEASSTAPVSVSLVSNAAVAENPTIAADLAQSAYAVNNSPLNGTSSFWSTIGTVMSEVYSGTTTTDNIQAKLDEAVETMQNAVNA